MIARITILCFAASYGVALALEISRLFFRLSVRRMLTLGMAAAGLLAHSLFLAHRATSVPEGGTPLSSWYDWYLVAAWIVAAAYLLLALTRPESALGVFLLPPALLLIGFAAPLHDAPPFPQAEAVSAWGKAHGYALLLGTVTVTLGFASGVMYLVQSYRLKHHLPPQSGFRLPSLEWLQKVNQQSMWLSTFLVALGLLAGIIYNAVKRHGSGGALPWTDSLVITSGMLLLWLVAATTFEYFYKPAQQGRKVAYITVASFIFLAAALFVSVFGGTKHAIDRGPPPNAEAAP